MSQPVPMRRVAGRRLTALALATLAAGCSTAPADAVAPMQSDSVQQGASMVEKSAETSSVETAGAETAGDRVVVEQASARLEAHIRSAETGQATVEYRLRNRGDAPLMVFDRGDRQAVLNQRLQPGEVAQPRFAVEAGDLTLNHRAWPLPNPTPTLPPTPLAAKLAPGAELQGRFTFSAPTLEPVQRLRWCLGVATFDGKDFSEPQQAGDVEVWQAVFAVAERQQLLCTPWFDVERGVFEAGAGH